MSYTAIGGGATHFATGVTSVECHKQVRSWRLLRALAELLLPTCNCTIVHEDLDYHPQTNKPKPKPHGLRRPPPITGSGTVLTGTIFGNRHGKVKLCIQTHTNSASPLLLLELAVSTSILAKEMRGGHLRIALESTNASLGSPAGNPLLSCTPVWTMYCNGRRVGFAIQRQPSKSDLEVLKKMGSVVSEAGVLTRKDLGSGSDDIMYLRGNFRRVCGSANSESFHLIDPDGNINQDLSIFFLRSR